MTVYDIEAQSIDGPARKLEEFRGKVLLIVNVASRCAFTGQYAGLEALYQRWKDRGLVILGFPCNQFGKQEPGDEAAIKSFCSLKYNVTFPMFRKVEVNGADTHPLYQLLKSEKPGTLGTTSIKWNFTKFLVDASGNVLRRYGPSTGAGRIEKDISSLLATPQAAG